MILRGSCARLAPRDHHLAQFLTERTPRASINRFFWGSGKKVFSAQKSPSDHIFRCYRHRDHSMIWLTGGLGPGWAWPAASLGRRVAASPPGSSRRTIPLMHEGARSPPDADGEARHYAKYRYFRLRRPKFSPSPCPLACGGDLGVGKKGVANPEFPTQELKSSSSAANPHI